jgi:hypothetical protein
MINTVNGNVSAIQAADYRLDTGLKFGDSKMIYSGVDLTLKNYTKGKTALPAKFNILAENYNIALAAELLEHTRHNSPLPTTESHKISTTLNMMVGALVSTALYTALSQTAYNSDNIGIISNLQILYHTMGSFAATYVGLGATGMASPYLLRGIQKVKNKVSPIVEKAKSKCSLILSRAKK